MSKFVLTAQLQLQAPNNVSQVVSQIQNQLNNVSVNVQVKGAAQANQQIQQITQSTKNATTAADRMGRAFAVSIRRFAAFSIATRAVGLFTSTLSEAVQTAIDFERELIKISQVTGRSVSSLRDLTDSVTNLSTNLGVTSQSLLEVTTVLTQAGLSSDDTKIALESLAKAALAPNFDSIQETAEGAIAILAQFKQGVGALEGQLSSIDAVAGAFAVEAGDLIDVIRRSGGVFKASGGSLNELLALFTSVRATTRESAESIGTGLRTIFTRIQRPETIEFLKQFGIELVDLNGKFVGPYEAIRRLSEALSGLGEGDLTFIRVAEELGGFRQIGKVLPLLQQFSTAQAALNVAQTAGNGLTKNAETAQAALAIRIIKVREEFLALVRSMTETPTFQIMANAALSLASALIKIADSIKPLLPLLGAVAAFKAVKGIGGFLGGIGAGLTSGKTFNAGGKVQAFATGGLVPGSGNRDTVPAMLTPGEFVIRKSSVQKLGASNLKQMNTGGSVSHFAVGGKASRKVDYEKGVAPSPFVSAKSNKLGQEAYALQKSSGLSQFEFDDAKRFADANGYNLQQFKTLIAKRAQDKKNKAGLKTNTADLLSTLRGSSEAKTLSPEAEKLRVMLGGTPRKFAAGGIAKTNIVGMAIPDTITKEPYNPIEGKASTSLSEVLNTKTGFGLLGSKSINDLYRSPSNKKFIPGKLPPEELDALAQKELGFKSKTYSTLREGVTQNDATQFSNIVNERVKESIKLGASDWANSVGVKLSPDSLTFADTFQLPGGFKGSYFESVLDAFQGRPIGAEAAEANRPFDFTNGLKPMGTLFDQLASKRVQYIDAKISGGTNINEAQYSKKITNQLASDLIEDPTFTQQINSISQARIAQNQNTVKKHFGGLIQKFNAGGVAKIQSLKFSNFRDIEKFLDDMWIRGIQEERRKRYEKDKSFIRASDSWTFKHPLVGSVSLTGKETEELYAYWESQKKSLLKKQKFQVDPTEAILDYKTDSSDINTGLSDKTLTKDQKKQVSTLKKLSTDKLPKTLYSGIGFNRTSIIQNQIGKNLLQSTGKTFALPGFLSTSSDVGVAKRFGNGLLLRIATNPARKGVAADKHVYNEYQHEKEFILPPNSKFKVSRFASNTLGVAQLNKGGIPNAPLIDDIDNATNTVLPRPSLAIARLLQAGGGAVDIDRTIKRTIGDKAFGSAKTDPQRTAALQTYFRDDSARLRDVQTAPLTQFGQELQSVIKSGKLDGRKVSIVSKSKRVPGVAEYLSQLFSIPTANMVFTAGQSKEPAMEAIRTKGPRVERVKKFFGGMIPKHFAVGGKADPKDTLEQYFADSTPFNLGLSNSRSLNKDQRKQLASNVRNMRQLRSQAPAQVYSSLSRNAFNKFASDTGLDKNPEIPEGTKLFDQAKYYSQAVTKIVGRSFSLPGFVSTSKEFGKAKMFLDNAPRDKDNWAAMLTINTKKNAQGVDVEQQLSGRKLNITKQDINPRTGKMETFFMQPPSAEKEVVLSPRSRFKVTSAKFVDLMGNKNVWADAQQFASGGLVPGVGNSDTVPATLQQGDFVIRKSSVAKLGVENLASMSGYASGGNVGKSVPALLTPGEWVVSKDQAQSIGYGNLNRMNKVGKFAKGGVVQRFASGTGTSGAVASSLPSSSSQPSGSLAAFNAAFKTSTQTVQQNTNAQQQATQIQQQSTQSTQDNSDAVEKNSLSFFAATMGLGAVQAALASITPVIDKNSTAFERASASILNSVSSLTNTIGIAVIALQQLNIQITAATAKMVAQNAVDFLTGAKSLTDVFKTAKDGIPGLKNFTNSFKIASGKGGGNFVMAPSRAGNLAGGAVNKLTGGTGTLGGLRNTINNIPVVKNLNPIGDSISQIGSNSRKIFGNAFSGGLTGQNGMFANAVRSSGFGSMSGSMGASARLTSMTQLTPMQKTVANIGGKLGNFALGVKSGFSGGKGIGGVAATLNNGPLTNSQMLNSTPAQRLAARKAQMSASAQATAKFGSSVGNIGATIAKPIGNIATKASSAVSSGITNLNKLAGPALALGLAFEAATSIVDAFSDYQGKANKAIQDGNVEKAAAMAKEAAGADAFNSLGSAIIGASALFGPLGLAVGTATAAVLKIGSELPVVGPVIKSAAIKIGTLFGGKTEGSIMALAAAQAQGVATQKALAQSGEAATKAMTDFQNGSISAVQALAATASGGASVMKEAEVNKKAIEENNKNKAGGISGVGRDILALGGFNPFLETSAARNAKIDAENKGLSDQSKKSQETLIQQSTPAINALSGDIAAAGGTFNDVMDQIQATNPGLYFALLNQGSGELKKSFDNIKKEVERAQKAFNAMNLGMQNVQGAAAAAALGVNNYVAAQQAGNIGLEQSLAVLEASVTSAAQGISDADFGKALNDAESTLRGFGASDQQIDKFRGNISAVNEVQKNQSTIFAGAKDKLAANIRKSNSADERKKAFSETIDEQLKAAGYDEETRKRFKDATGNMSDDQLKKIGEGDFSAFEESINELGKKTMEQVNGPLKAAIEIQKQLNDLTKQRIEAERQLMNAQLEASNVRMEAMDIAAKYGGPKVTPEMRAKNIVQQANIQSQGIKGVTDLKTGSAQELSQRTQQLSTRQAEISAIKMRAAQGDAGAQKQLQGESGLKLQEEEKKLQDAAKSQIQATRDLIKSKEEELRLIKEKNQLEKSSIDALVSGDIEKFFDQQAAVGAQAAIATGDQRMIGQFGMSALGAAAQETRRQQEAGVTELYGRQLSGPGGLTESAYGAALSSAGIQNPLAMAQVAAGSTGAEAAIESDIRDLAATMGPAADVQTQAAQDQLIAAQMQLDAARAKGEEAVAQMQARQAPGMATGGMVYASRGIFVPRGTDTVPAMLTPGEFVVNRAAVQRGNNLQILQSMNKGVSASAPAASSQSGDVAAMASGGIVRYRSGGSTGPEAGGGLGISTEALNSFAAALSQFNTELTKNIQTLASTKFEITLNPTNINVNLTGTSFLSNLAANIKQDLLKFLGEEISNYSVGNDGKLRKTGSTLGTIT